MNSPQIQQMPRHRCHPHPGLMFPPIIKAVKRIKIHYDNGESYDARDVKDTNARDVSKIRGEYLTYAQRTPIEISEGVFQEASFAVDMFDVVSLDIYLVDGEVLTRKFSGA